MNQEIAGFSGVELCGRGATSRVYRAVRDGGAGRVVALKRLDRRLAQAPEALARLRRELEALGRIRHPAIVAVHEVLRWNGDPTLVMDYVDGEDLAARLAAEGPLPAAEVTDIGRQLFDVLAAAHGAGIVHRDVKPQNVRLGDDGQVRLLDFGSARLGASSQLTATGATVGTPDYMAPELFSGPAYDPRVDVYGVGATLYECLTGRPPQQADSLAELAYQRIHEDPPRVRELRPDVPEALALVVDRCLAREPGDRYPSAARAAWALDHPGPERAYAARLDRRPPCLHCDRPIDPASGRCPRCEAERPFRFGPGPFHVDLTAVRDPEAFVLHVARRHPERASREHAEALLQRVAALDHGPQRYVSFVDEASAKGIVDRLGEVGAVGRVRRGAGLSPLGLAMFGAGVVMALNIAAALAPWRRESRYATLVLASVPVVFALVSWMRSRSGILAKTRFAAAVRPGLIGLCLLGMLAAFQPVVLPGVFGSPYLPFDGAPTLFAIAFLVVGMLGVESASFLHPATAGRPVTAPPTLFALLRMRGRAWDRFRRSARRWVAMAGMLVVLGLELLFVMPLAHPHHVDGSCLLGIDRQERYSRRWQPDPPASAWGGAPARPPIAAFGLALASMALAHRRRRRLAARARAAVAGFDGQALAALAGRDGPDRAAWAECPGLRERSWLARCLLETDPELAARFQFLAFEGQREVELAETWAAELPAGAV